MTADDDATRMRLVELRSNNGFPRAIRFTPRLTLVTGFGPSERVGSWIASALVGPRPEGVQGTVEVAGRALELGDLPATLLPPRSSIVIADAQLDAARRQAIEPRHRRVVSRREAAEAERARDEIARNAAAGRFAALERRLAEIEPALAETIERAAFDEQRAQTIASLQKLLADVDQAAIAAREPHPEALDLATEWLTLRAQRAELAAAHPKLSVAEAQRRVEVAEGALEHARRTRATAEHLARLRELQRAVSDASSEIGTENGTDEADAEHARGREVALEAERDALRQLGHTHASFLISAVGQPSHEEDLRQAAANLAASRDELRQAQTVAALPSWPELAQQQLDLRGRAAAVLGRFPGDDVAGELRAYRPGAPALAEARAKLEAGLTAAAIDAPTDFETAAAAWLEEQQQSPPVDHASRVVELSNERDNVETDLRAQAAELVAIGARLRDLDRRLGELAVQQSRLAAELDMQLERCTPDDIERALSDVLDEFVAGRRVPGHLPIVVAGAAAAFSGETRERTLRELERASETLQVVLIVDDEMVEAWADTLGPDASVWSPDVAARVDAEERARREAEQQARRDAEQRAVREAEDRARREQEAYALREAEQHERTVRPLPYASRGVVDLTSLDTETERESHAVAVAGAEAETDGEGDEDLKVHTASTARLLPPEPPLTSGPPAPTDFDAPATSELQVVDAREVVDVTGSVEPAETDDWWVPIVARPGASRATRPVGEDLTQRRRRAEQLAADAASSSVHCDVHRNVDTALHCARCALPFCEQCLALLGEPPALHCVDCALELSGVRSGRASGHQ